MLCRKWTTSRGAPNSYILTILAPAMTFGFNIASHSPAIRAHRTALSQSIPMLQTTFARSTCNRMKQKYLFVSHGRQHDVYPGSRGVCMEKLSRTSENERLLSNSIEVEAYCPDPQCPRITSIFPPIPETPLPPLIFHIKTGRRWNTLSSLVVAALKVAGFCHQSISPH